MHKKVKLIANLHMAESIGFEYAYREQRGQDWRTTPNVTASIRLYKIWTFQTWWATVSPHIAGQLPLFRESTWYGS